jgi:hypothetical protein
MPCPWICGMHFGNEEYRSICIKMMVGKFKGKYITVGTVDGWAMLK